MEAFKENEKVTLNGKNYVISKIEWSKGHKACMLCANINRRPPCIDAFNYPESDNVFDLLECSKKMPEFCIPKLVTV